jgi:hypothetical protein
MGDIRMSKTMVSRRLVIVRAAQITLGASAAALFPVSGFARVTMNQGAGLALSSAGFADGETIPTRYACDGANLSPALSWSGAPDGTESFALVCYDPDAPGGAFHHWAIYDLPGDREALREGFPKGAEAEGARQAVNDFGEAGYKGPCPPHGHGVHHYHFDLFALPAAQLKLPQAATCGQVLAAARGRALASASLIGLYKR